MVYVSTEECDCVIFVHVTHVFWPPSFPRLTEGESRSTPTRLSLSRSEPAQVPLQIPNIYLVRSRMRFACQDTVDPPSRGQ